MSELELVVGSEAVRLGNNAKCFFAKCHDCRVSTVQLYRSTLPHSGDFGPYPDTTPRS